MPARPPTRGRRWRTASSASSDSADARMKAWTRRTPASRYAPSRSTRAAPVATSRSVQTWTETGSVAGSRPISSHRDRITGSASRTSAGSRPSRLSSSAKRAASRQVTFGPFPPTRMGTRGCWTGFGTLIASAHVRVGALERRVGRASRLEHPRDDLEVVGEPGEPLAGLGKAVAVGDPLVALPAGADPELHPSAADGIHRRDHLRGQCGVPERRADHDVPQPDARGERRERRERGEGLERDLVGRARHGVEVVVQPDGLEARGPRPAGRPRRSAARRGASPSRRTRPPSLRRDDPDLHGSSDATGYSRPAIRGTTCAATAWALASVGASM